jgi:citronellyl-CoA dehydrogenase
MRFTEEHDQLRRTVREFVDKEVNPHMARWDEDGAFPAHELFKKAGRLGMLGVKSPKPTAAWASTTRIKWC